ncbi:hypothetical protein PCASD_09504 [Puccinia coronata f. sp. avenae]|uniref:Uncharacterized protein n=1 Tax=Puccinia coronata f. sp. avenae TaxID=200324 RepID=A0A2N5U633_9BASI|nr:hypothetical protein PCASD_09504 [Puccinia coronata f. sp. avenae]
MRLRSERRSPSSSRTWTLTEQKCLTGRRGSIGAGAFHSADSSQLSPLTNLRQASQRPRSRVRVQRTVSNRADYSRLKNSRCCSSTNQPSTSSPDLFPSAPARVGCPATYCILCPNRITRSLWSSMFVVIIRDLWPVVSAKLAATWLHVF